MANKEQVKKVILDVAGNPESGIIRELADAWASAIVGLDSASSETSEPEKAAEDSPAQQGELHERPVKEVRVMKPSEIR